MRDLQSLAPERLLAIPETQPERLFSEDAAEAKAEFKALAMRWHPDHSGDEVVFKHVDALYKLAVEKMADGKWLEPAVKIEDEEPGVLRLRVDGDKKPIKIIRYRKHVPFELGDMYINTHIVAYLVRNEFADLFESARKLISRLAYENKAMRDEVSRYLPSIESIFYTKDHSVMVVKKTPDLVRLQDLLDHLGGKIDPRHVAWIQNTLHNLVCYFGWAKLSHNAIGPDTYFISPELHSGTLLGGWWYAKHQDARLDALPERTLRYIPPDVLRKKRADIRTDLELVRATGRELLGDITGMKLVGDKDIPQPMVEWLRHPTSGNPVNDYTQWAKTVLPASYGRRRFVKLEVNPSDIYKEK